MQKISTKTTIMVEMSAEEYDALRMLCERLQHRDEYAGGTKWKLNMLDDRQAEIVENLIKED
jgi:hypothetical protein